MRISFCLFVFIWNVLNNLSIYFVLIFLVVGIDVELNCKKLVFKGEYLGSKI